MRTTALHVEMCLIFVLGDWAFPPVVFSHWSLNFQTEEVAFHEQKARNLELRTNTNTITKKDNDLEGNTQTPTNAHSGCPVSMVTLIVQWVPSRKRDFDCIDKYCVLVSYTRDAKQEHECIRHTQSPISAPKLVPVLLEMDFKGPKSSRI